MSTIKIDLIKKSSKIYGVRNLYHVKTNTNTYTNFDSFINRKKNIYFYDRIFFLNYNNM